MPIRTATVNRQLEKNGAKLHLAMLSRIHVTLRRSIGMSPRRGWGPSAS